MGQQQTEEFAPLPVASYKEGEGRELAVVTPAYATYSKEMIALVGKTIMPVNYQPAELYYVLELAARYGLDPLLKEIWAVRMSSNPSEPVTTMVGVEGLLAVAERHPDYRGVENLEVYANDTFSFSSKAKKQPNGTYSHVTHDFDVTGDRGDLLGAYAEVYRSGRPPTFFWAPLAEYMRTGSQTPWSKQKTAMIRKCALANALRRAFKLSGLYIAEEMSGASLMRNGAPIAAGQQDDVEVQWDDEWREQRVTDLFATLEQMKPGAYLPGRRKLMLASADTDEFRDELIAQLEREIVEAGGELPDPPEPEAAEVVDDGGSGDGDGDVDAGYVPTAEELADAEAIPFGEPEEDGQGSLPVE